LLLLAGCGGGGGGGGPASTASNIQVPIGTPTNPEGAYDTAEYRLNSGLKQINAGAA
jgi:hypothetical protein